MRFKLNLKIQSGRSMTEMLGVLAIIGVLSISALFGYNYAITKYKSNTTINDLNQFVILVTQQMLNGRDTLDLSEAGNKTTLNYPATAYILEDARYFEIALGDVPANVCQQILREELREPLIIKVNGYAYVGDTSVCQVDDAGTPVEMVFQYVADLDEDVLPYGTCRVDADCIGDCVRCNEDGLCVSTCSNGERCSTDLNTGNKVCCPPDRRSGPYCCPSAVNGWCCDENKENCCPWHKPLRDKNGTCYACDYATGVDVTGVNENCNVCTNRELIGNSCVEKCPADRPLRSSSYNVCYSCMEKSSFTTKTPEYCTSTCPNRVANGALNRFCSLPCKEGQFTDHDGNCRDCDDPKTYSVDYVTHDGCENCSNREQYVNDCVLICPEGQIRDSSGKCRDCDDEEPIEFGSSTLAQRCISACPNRVLNGYADRVCSYDLCGQGIFKNKPLTDWNGKCHACDESKSVTTMNIRHEGCEMCDNRYLVGDRCVLDCPKGEFRDGSGVCRDCNDKETYFYQNVIAQDCVKRCPNRVLNGWSDQACAFDLCGQGIFKDKPLTNLTGKCHSCDEPNIVNVERVLHEGCDMCPDTRNKFNHMCVLKCPDDTPLKGYNNKCYPCDTEERVNVSYMTDSCYECPNERKLDGNYCVLK